MKTQEEIEQDLERRFGNEEEFEYEGEENE